MGSPEILNIEGMFDNDSRKCFLSFLTLEQKIIFQVLEKLETLLKIITTKALKLLIY